MENVLKKIVQIVYVFFIILITGTIVSCSDDHKGHDKSNVNNQETKFDSSIIRTGEIDLQSLDTNKDGMVYQDPMDWNVISDKPGKCPLCKMTLEEVSIKDAKENLVQNGFEVK